MTTQGLESFYQEKFNWMPDDLKKDIGHFNVFDLADTYGHGKPRPQYARRDFYKIMLIRGQHLFHYADRTLEVNGSYLLFFNPQVPYKFERITTNPSGYFCIFKEAFFADHLRPGLKTLPMFTPGGQVAYALNEEQDAALTVLFQKMRDELVSDYRFKYELIRNYVLEMIHGALKMEASVNLYPHADANARLTAVFTDLLERQFPIESLSQAFDMRSPKQFADQLHVHINHLNRAIRTVTGKTTSELIFERMITEARALLQHTDWNVAEISHCLGFDDPSHFNRFFKKHTGNTPASVRSAYN